MDTAGIEVPNSRAIAKQLLALAKDPDNQPFIVQEQGCLAGLVQYTQHDDIDVVLIATRALQFLSSHPENKEPMSEFPELISSLTLTLPRSAEHPKVLEFCKNVFQNLGVCVDLSKYEVVTRHDIEIEESKGSCDTMYTKSAFGVKPRECGEFRTVSLFVEDVSVPNVRYLVETLIISVEGVISVTVNPERSHVLIGTRELGDSLTKTLIAKLSAEGLVVKLVIPGPNKREGPEYENLDSQDYPEYLEEEDYDYDDECQDTERVTRQGFSSLEARLEQQRLEEESRKLEKCTRLIGKMNNMLSNASSWLMGY
mmetsp:Transcript_11296/g.20881  ORF Transcript_11296/g.20881 Transcript_11296/m.20881 type:complete len:312 (-) Transcript_11296:188-1123(-)